MSINKLQINSVLVTILYHFRILKSVYVHALKIMQYCNRTILLEELYCFKIISTYFEPIEEEER